MIRFCIKSYSQILWDYFNFPLQFLTLCSHYYFIQTNLIINTRNSPIISSIAWTLLSNTPEVMSLSSLTWPTRFEYYYWNLLVARLKGNDKIQILLALLTIWHIKMSFIAQFNNLTKEVCLGAISIHWLCDFDLSLARHSINTYSISISVLQTLNSYTAAADKLGCKQTPYIFHCIFHSTTQL